VTFPDQSFSGKRLPSGQSGQLGKKFRPKSVPGNIAEKVMRASIFPVATSMLKPLIDKRFIEFTIPDKPRSSKQRYRVTDLGRQWLKQW